MKTPPQSPMDFDYTTRAPDGSFLKLDRKISKPIMEKKRRARINTSLDQLKSLLVEVLQKEGCRHSSKMEKADILEMTVKHLRCLQRQQLHAAPGTPSTLAHPSPNQMAKYYAGFAECLGQVSQYLVANHPKHTALRVQLLSHISQMSMQVSRGSPSGESGPQQTVPRAAPNVAIGQPTVASTTGFHPYSPASSAGSDSPTLSITGTPSVGQKGSPSHNLPTVFFPQPHQAQAISACLTSGANSHSVSVSQPVVPKFGLIMPKTNPVRILPAPNCGKSCAPRAVANGLESQDVWRPWLH